jgi:Fur family ferric uptake transcriptional regulator
VSTTEQEITTALREAGLRVTRPRRLVFAALREAGGHRSVDDIVRLCADRGESLGRMTIYNVVGDLTRVGLVMCADAGPGRALYEAADEWHHHYVCRLCGAIFDVPCAKGEKPCLDPPDDAPGTVDEAQVIFRGVCHACAASQHE